MGFHIGSGSGKIALIENQIPIQMLHPVLIICHRRSPKDALTAMILLYLRTQNVNVSANLLRFCYIEKGLAISRKPLILFGKTDFSV